MTIDALQHLKSKDFTGIALKMLPKLVPKPFEFKPDEQCKVLNRILKRENVIELTIQTSLKFQHGDAFGVYCPNAMQIVDEIIEKLEYQETPNAKNLFSVIDLKPKKALLRKLSEYCTNVQDRNILLYLSSQNGKQEYLLLESIMDVLNLIDCKPPISVFEEYCSIQTPRYYSIVDHSEDSVTFCFDIHQNGKCTPWLATTNELVPIFQRPVNSFRLVDGDLLLICTGTGIAPMISLISGCQSNIVLVYGHRTENDSLYLERIGPNVTLFECLSRQESKYSYVYQVLPDLDKTFIENATIYVCGSVAMGNSVMNVLENIISDEKEVPKEYWKDRMKNGTYKREIWG